jgi:CheY-like chemotaxis protein
MTKIMLVEDDKSLREIYGVRLLAEGYDIVSAGDGEEALAMAIKERPILIVTDVMMPKISGFDMLDILRSTTETKNIKVIVMTALGSEEQRIRGDQLGADRYLVKSQVGIEDVVRAVHDVLGDKPATAPQPSQPAMTAPASPAAARTSIPINQPAPGPQPSTQRTMASVPAHPPATATIAPTPPQSASTMQAPQTSPVPVGRNRVIQPLTDPSANRVDINELLDRELAKEAGIDLDNRPVVPTTAQEQAVVAGQLNSFSGLPSTMPPAPSPQASTIQIDAQGNVSMPPATPSQAPQAGPPPVPPPPVR